VSFQFGMGGLLVAIEFCTQSRSRTMMTFARDSARPGPALEIDGGAVETREGDRPGNKSFTPPAILLAPPDAAMKAQITAFEASITHRQLREAALGANGGWLREWDARIAASGADITA
jgi:hypothetical protein